MTVAAGLLVLALGAAFAENPVICVDPQQPPIKVSPAYSDVAKRAVPDGKLGWWAADDNHIKGAPCRAAGPPTQDFLDKYLADIDATSSEPVASRTINGVTFENENPRMLDLFQKLTTYNSWSDEQIKKNQKTFTSTCKKVLCAAKEIFTPELAPKLLYMLDRYGFNGSQFAFVNSDAWKPEELDDVLTGISDIPPSMLPFERNRRLTHFTRGYSLAIYGDSPTLANAQISVFDLWNIESASTRQMAIAHELGHYIGGQLKLDSSKTWLGMSGWRQETKVVNGKEQTNDVADKPGTIMSKYGGTNPSEDFAETVAAYRYNPELLKAKSPEKYALMKETVFDGLEYTSSDACDPSKSTSERLKKVAAKKLEDSPVPRAYADDAKKKCGRDLLDVLAVGSIPENPPVRVQECFSRSISSSALVDAATSEKFQYPEFAKAALQQKNSTFAPEAKIGDSVKQARNELKAAMIRSLATKDAESYQFSDKYSKQMYVNGSAYCNIEYDTYAYQKIAREINSDFASPQYGTTNLAYDYKTSLNKLASEVCNKIEAGQKRPVKLTPEAVEKALAPYFP